MSTAPTPPEPQPLLEQACAWLSKMHSGEFSRVEQQQLATWRAADPAQERAWQQAQATWQKLEGLRSRNIPGSQPLIQERYRKKNPPPTVSTRPSPRRHRRLLSLAIACSAILAVTMPTLYSPNLWQADYLTEKGQQRTVMLADGSRVTLNSASALAVHFDEALRRVELLQGEAFFDVAKNRQIPFVVTTAGKEVRAVGTAFSVQRGTEQTKVELVEGIVEIQDARHQHHERLRAGQTALIGADNVSVETASRPDSMALWRDGYLQFDSLPLQEAITQINRYRPGRVVLLNQSLADKRVSGLFRLDALDQAIASLKTAVPALQTLSITPYLVVLR